MDQVKEGKISQNVTRNKDDGVGLRKQMDIKSAIFQVLCTKTGQLDIVSDCSEVLVSLHTKDVKNKLQGVFKKYLEC